MSRELAHALDALLFSHWDNANAAVERQKAGLKGKKAFARQVLSEGYLTEEIKKDMIIWKGEGQDKREDEGMKMNDADEDEERGSGTVDEDDWSSTSTLA